MVFCVGQQFPKEVREVDTEGRLPIHCLAQNRREANEYDTELLQMFMKVRGCLSRLVVSDS